MSESGITILMAPLPGQRLVDGGEPEDGSVLAYRKGGDEALFASWDADNSRPMAWIKIGEFSPDPEAIRPPEIVEEDQPSVQEAEDGTQERPVVEGPFGRGRGRSKRPQAD
jgi:hypothetical protein